MKRLDERDETVVLSTKIPAALGVRLRHFQREQSLPNKSAAVRALLERGLDAPTTGDE